MAVKEVNSYTYLAGILVVTYFKTTFRKKEQKSPYYEELIQFLFNSQFWGVYVLMTISLEFKPVEQKALP